MMKNVNDDIRSRARKIKLLLMDCDGVLTDGKIYLNENGEETKSFNIKDGQGLVSLHRAGVLTGIITGRVFKALDIRGGELGVKFIRQGCEDKVAEFENILGDAGATPEETAYVGDDIPDIPLLKKVGLAIAVADAVEEVKEAAHWVTARNGGDGAVREVTDLILNSKT